jgi:hypothetical protein
MKLRKLNHLEYVAVRTNSRIGTGLDGCTVTYLSGVGQPLEMGPGL